MVSSYNGATSDQKGLVTLWAWITRDRDHASEKTNRSETDLSYPGLKTYKQTPKRLMDRMKTKIWA
jgi:hypothetical protein